MQHKLLRKYAEKNRVFTSSFQHYAQKAQKTENEIMFEKLLVGMEIM